MLWTLNDLPEVNVTLCEILFSSCFTDVFLQFKHWLRDYKDNNVRSKLLCVCGRGGIGKKNCIWYWNETESYRRGRCNVNLTLRAESGTKCEKCGWERDKI